MSLFRFPPQDPKPPYMECKPRHIKDAVWRVDNIDKYFKKSACDEEILLGYTINYAIFFSVITGMWDFHPDIEFYNIWFQLCYWNHCKLYYEYMSKYDDKDEAIHELNHNHPTVCGVSKRIAHCI